MFTKIYVANSLLLDCCFEQWGYSLWNCSSVLTLILQTADHSYIVFPIPFPRANCNRLTLVLLRLTRVLLLTALYKKILVTNPLTPGAFCKKRIFWTFWRFWGWILAKLAFTCTWSKMHLKHDSLPLLPLVLRFMTFWLRHVLKSKF